MRKNNAFVFALVCLLVVLVALWIKGDVTASVEGLGVKMLIDVKDKRPSPTPHGSPTPAAPDATKTDANPPSGK